MAKVTMDMVKDLRAKTQVGMMDCKKALEQADGDMEKAIEILRKKGAAVAAKRAGKATENGRIEAYVTDDFKHGALVEIGCETDFSANTPDMKEFALKAAQEAATNQIDNSEKLFSEKPELKNNLDELLAKISEKIQINTIKNFNVSEHGIVNHYIHPGSTVGVFIELATEHDVTKNLNDLKVLARDICMHIAVTSPLCVSPEDLDPKLLEKERAIMKEQLQNSNKPANIMDKIIDGKIKKYYEEVCLTYQKFIKNEDVTIAQHVKQLSDKLNNTITIKQFVRLSIGR